MPALTNVQQPPIMSAVGGGGARQSKARPSPRVDGLSLEVMSARELGWWGQRFGVDTPYVIVPLGWGEWVPYY